MLIVRDKEKEILKTTLNADEARFLAVYGRRRVSNVRVRLK